MDKYEIIKDRLEAVHKGLEIARATSNEPLMWLNISLGFGGHLLRALYFLREGRPPGDELDRAIDFIVDYRDQVEEITEIPIDRVNILCFLADRPKLDIGEVEFPVADMTLDYLLGEALFGADVAADWNGLLESVAGDKRQQLMVRTYRNYLELLDSRDGPSEAIQELVTKGEELFRARRRNGWYSGADRTEGGGLDNENTVDYRLLALRKAAGLPI